MFQRRLIAGGQGAEQTLANGLAGGGGGLDHLGQARHVLGQDGFEQFGLVLEVGEDGAGGHARALGDVADGGGLVAPLCEQRAGGVQNLLPCADLGGLAAVQARFDGEGCDGISHEIRLLLYFKSRTPQAGPKAT